VGCPAGVLCTRLIGHQGNSLLWRSVLMENFWLQQVRLIPPLPSGLTQPSRRRGSHYQSMGSWLGPPYQEDDWPLASIYSLAFSAESAMLVSGGADWTVRCWDVKSAGACMKSPGKMAWSMVTVRWRLQSCLKQSRPSIETYVACIEPQPLSNISHRTGLIFLRHFPPNERL